MGISQLDIMPVYRRATISVDMRAASVGALKALTQIITGSPAERGALKAPLSVSSPAALRYGHETIGEDSAGIRDLIAGKPVLEGVPVYSDQCRSRRLSALYSATDLCRLAG